jgi:hypothetical protein
MSLSLGLVLATTVAVDLSGLDAAARARIDADRLHGQLLVRLAEEGYGVRAPSGPTSYRLDLRSSPDRRVLLMVTGAEERSDELFAGPAPVHHLEIIQRALLLLDEVQPSPASPAVLPTVFVRYPALTDEEAANRAYGRMAILLVEDGFELVGTPGRAERLVCISSAGDPIWLPSDRAHGDCAAAAKDAESGQPPAKQWSLPMMTGASGTLLGRADAGASTRAAAATRLELARAWYGGPQERPGWTLGASTGFLVRGPEVDPTFGLSLSFGSEEGFFASAIGRMTGASPGRLEVFEAIAAAGPGGRVTAGRVTFQASVVAGVFFHHFWPSRESTYRRWDWIVLLPFDLSVRLNESWRFHGTASLGLAEEGHFKYIDNRFVWHRRPDMIGLEIGLSRDF